MIRTDYQLFEKKRSPHSHEFVVRNVSHFVVCNVIG